MVVLHFLVILLVIIVHDCESGRNPSRVQWPVVKPSLGQVWPKPQFHVSSNYVFTITPQSFSFFNTGRKCRILEEAFVRYNDLIFNPPRKAILKSPTYKSFIHISVSGNVKYLNVTLNGKCEEWPYHGMDEKCEYCIMILFGIFLRRRLTNF